MSNVTENACAVWAWTWNCPQRIIDENSIDAENLWCINAAQRMQEVLDAKATKYAFEGERGEEKARLHLQGWLSLKKKTRGQHLGNIDDIFTEIHIRPAVNPKLCQVYDELENYCLKDAVLGPWCDKGHEKRVEEKKREEDMKLEVQSRKHEVLTQEQLYGWQRELFLRTLTPPDKTTVEWIWDQTGQAGKTELKRHCVHFGNAGFLSYVKYDKAMTIVAANPQVRAWIIDLTRVKPKDIAGDDIYSVAEQIKSGMFNKTEYNCEAIKEYPKVHVLFFANCKPKFEGLSLSRWKVWKLSRETCDEKGEQIMLTDPSKFQLIPVDVKHEIETANEEFDRKNNLKNQREHLRNESLRLSIALKAARLAKLCDPK
jgi:hypothetical protein